MDLLLGTSPFKKMDRVVPVGAISINLKTKSDGAH